MSLNVTILSDQEFDELPYSETQVSLGVADTNKGEAYVRYVANDELQKYLINHELEHLLGEDRDEIHHGGDGIYYKGFGNMFSGIGNAFGGAMNSIGGAASSIGRGISGVGSQLAGSLGNAMNFGGGFRGGANPSGGMAAAAASNPGLRAPIGAGFGGLSAMGQALGQFRPSMMSTQGMPSGMSAQQMGMQIPKSFGSGASSMMRPPIQTNQSKSPVQSIGSTINGLLGGGQQPGQGQSGMNLGQAGLGAGISLLGDLFAPKVGRIPDLSSLGSVQNLQNYNMRQGMGGELDPAFIDATNRDFDRMDQEELRDFTSRWKNIRPGADLESDSVYARDYNELKRQQAVRRGDAMANYRFQMIKNNLALSDLEMKRLSEIATLDIATIMGNLGMDAQEAANFKETFGNIGGAMISSGLGLNQPQTQNA